MAPCAFHKYLWYRQALSVFIMPKLLQFKANRITQRKGKLRLGDLECVGGTFCTSGRSGERCILKITREERAKRGLEALAEHGLPWRELQANDRIMASGRGAPRGRQWAHCSLCSFTLVPVLQSGQRIAGQRQSKGGERESALNFAITQIYIPCTTDVPHWWRLAHNHPMCFIIF